MLLLAQNKMKHGETGRSNKHKKMSSFRSKENIHKKEDGSYYVGSANKASSVTLTRQRKPEETYYNFANFK